MEPPKRGKGTKREEPLLEEVEWQDLERLPLDVRRIAALSLSWGALEKGCSSKALASICRDPEFWFQKLKNEKLALDRPIVKRWIELWIGTPNQEVLLTNLIENLPFNLPIISQLIVAEYSAKELGKGTILNLDPITELAQRITQDSRELHIAIKDLIELESVEENLNTAINITKRRRDIFQLRVARSGLTSGLLLIELPEWAEEIKDEDIKTYSDYLELIRRYPIPDFELFTFLVNIAIIQEFGHSRDPTGMFSRYLEDNPQTAKYYQNMVHQKAIMIGLHFKSGDLLNIGDRYYIVIREGQKINLFQTSGRYLPAEALSILIQHNVEALVDLHRLYSDFIGIILDSRRFIFANKDAPQHDIEGHTFYGYFEGSKPGLSTRLKPKAKAKARAVAKEEED